MLFYLLVKNFPDKNLFFRIIHCNFATTFPRWNVVYAQMAESVDALVSNTSGAIRPGSTPGLGTKDNSLRNKIVP